jgi:two-component system cell cycle sensor histidine kinase/response regulator CckA
VVLASQDTFFSSKELFGYGAGNGPRNPEAQFRAVLYDQRCWRGTGLGLAMVYGIVRQHDGYVVCQSEPGAGTTFKVYFPALRFEAEDGETPLNGIPQGGTESILLVDDEEFVRNLGKRLLSKDGYTVPKAATVNEALEQKGLSGSSSTNHRSCNQIYCPSSSMSLKSRADT